MNKVERYREKIQYETLLQVSERDWQPYTPEEEDVVLRTDMTLCDIALTLGRSYRAVREKRKKLRRMVRTVWPLTKPDGLP